MQDPHSTNTKKTLSTLVLKSSNTDDTWKKKAADLLRNGQVVAFPTETVYGLGAVAIQSQAVQKIFLAKGRPSDNPLILHVSSYEMLYRLVSPSSPTFPAPGSRIREICDRFWPGPLTLLFDRSEIVPDIVTAGLDTVAIRMPSNKVAKDLIEEVGEALAAPSANKSGRPSPTTAAHVEQDLSGAIPLIIDGGPCSIGLESTVLHLSFPSSSHPSPSPVILRPGAVTVQHLRPFLPDVELFDKDKFGNHVQEKPPTPGMKYQHYSPTAKVILFEDGASEKLLKEAKETKGKFGVVCTKEETMNKLKEILEGEEVHVEEEEEDKKGEKRSNPSLPVFSLIGPSSGGPSGDSSLEDTFLLPARLLFASLRMMDDLERDVVLVEGVSDMEEGAAIMNRLRKAASCIFTS